jgi:hypothetical protein
MSVGLITRTRIGVRPIGVGSCRMHGPLAGSGAGRTLAGAPNLAIMAGRGALCPERKLKGTPACF